jgi:hypothetical protein
MKIKQDINIYSTWIRTDTNTIINMNMSLNMNMNMNMNITVNMSPNIKMNMNMYKKGVKALAPERFTAYRAQLSF